MREEDKCDEVCTSGSLATAESLSLKLVFQTLIELGVPPPPPRHWGGGHGLVIDTHPGGD